MKKFLFGFLIACFATAAGAQVPMTGAGLPVPAASASAPTLSWHNEQNNAFTAAATAILVGKTSALGTCGTFVSGHTDYAWVTTQGNPADTIVPPSGWTIMGTKITDGTILTAFFSHPTTGAESCATGFNFTWTTSSFMSWGLFEIAGAAASPIDGIPSIATFSTGATTIIAQVGLTTANAPDLLLDVIIPDTNCGSVGGCTLPVGFTQVVNVQQESSTISYLLGTETLASSGLVGTQNGATQTTFQSGNYGLFAVHP
jgi:hypothetical protein